MRFDFGAIAFICVGDFAIATILNIRILSESDRILRLSRLRSLQTSRLRPRFLQRSFQRAKIIWRIAVKYHRQRHICDRNNFLAT